METAKNRTILVLTALSIILLLINMKSCNVSQLKEQNLTKEQTMRIALEEKIVRLESEITQLKTNLEKTNKDFSLTKKLLVEQQLLNDALKEQLQKTKDAQAVLEDGLSRKKR